MIINIYIYDYIYMYDYIYIYICIYIWNISEVKSINSYHKLLASCYTSVILNEYIHALLLNMFLQEFN